MGTELNCIYKIFYLLLKDTVDVYFLNQLSVNCATFKSKNKNELKMFNPKLWCVCSLGIYSITVLNILLNFSKTGMFFFDVLTMLWQEAFFRQDSEINFLSEGLLDFCSLKTSRYM